MVTAQAFRQVLAGADFQVIKLPHPWLTILAQNFDGRAALLIRTSLSDEHIVSDGRGFVVKTERNGTDDYVRISSAEPGAPAVFLKLVEHVLDRTRAATSLEAAKRALVDSVDEFRLFVARRGGRLSEDEIRGLFAELTLLRLLISSGGAVDAVVSAWKGPLSGEGIGLHDFTFPSGRGIEVKSTHQPPTEVRVSSPAQLRFSGSQLDLVVLPLEEVPLGTIDRISFRTFVLDTEALISAAGPATAERWRAAVRALDLDLEDEYYDQWAYSEGPWLRFSVAENFPTIPTDGIPQGVVKITYSLELQHLAEFIAPFEDLLALGAH